MRKSLLLNGFTRLVDIGRATAVFRLTYQNLEGINHLLKVGRLETQFIRRGSALFGGCGIGLGDLVHLIDSGGDLSDALALFL